MRRGGAATAHRFKALLVDVWSQGAKIRPPEPVGRPQFARCPEATRESCIRAGTQTRSRAVPGRAGRVLSLTPLGLRREVACYATQDRRASAITQVLPLSLACAASPSMCWGEQREIDGGPEAGNKKISDNE